MPALTVKKERLPFRLYLLIIFLFFAYVRPYEIFTFLIPLTLTRVFMISALLFYLLSRKENKTFVWKESTFWWFMLLQFSGLVLLPFSTWKAQSLTWFTESNLRIVATFFLLIIACSSRARLSAVVKTAFICCFLVSIRVILAYRSGDYIYDIGGVQRVIGVATLGSEDPNDMALVLAMAIPLGIYYMYSRKGLFKLFYFIMTATVLIALVYTGSRGGYLGLSFGVVTFFALLYRKKKMKFVLVMGLLWVLALTTMPQQYKARFMSIFDENDYSRSDEQYGRVGIWKRSWRAMCRRPVGYGLKNASVAEGREKEVEGLTGMWMVTHNSYLQIGLELGFLGLFFYLMFLKAGFKNIKQSLSLAASTNDRDAEIISCGLAGGLAAFMVSSFFLSQAYYWNQYIFIAFTLGLRRSLEAKNFEMNGVSTLRKSKRVK